MFFSVKCKLYYDQNYKRKFGDETLNSLRRITVQAQNIFHWPSLTVKFQLNVSDIQEIPISLSGPDDQSL